MMTSALTMNMTMTKTYTTTNTKTMTKWYQIWHFNTVTTRFTRITRTTRFTRITKTTRWCNCLHNRIFIEYTLNNSDSSASIHNIGLGIVYTICQQQCVDFTVWYSCRRPKPRVGDHLLSIGPHLVPLVHLGFLWFPLIHLVPLMPPSASESSGSV